MKIVNKNVAVEPLKSNHEEVRTVRGIDMSNKLTLSLLQTIVVFDSENYKKGDYIYFRSDALRHPGATSRLTHDGVTFVLLPEDMVIGYDAAPAQNGLIKAEESV